MNKAIALKLFFAKSIQRWPELFILPFIVTAVIFLPTLLKVIDPGAGEYDLSIIQSIIIALFIQMFVNLTTFGLVKYNFPNQYKWYINRFHKEPDQVNGDTWPSWWFWALFLSAKLEFWLILRAII